jgi:hypothetical protein
MRRLNVVGELPGYADADITNAAEIAQHSGFSELGRFAAMRRVMPGFDVLSVTYLHDS